jgi:hypothetical protein
VLPMQRQYYRNFFANSKGGLNLFSALFFVSDMM